MERKSRAKKSKLVYGKPSIKRVVLIPEEACLAGCKSISMGGQYPMGCVIGQVCPYPAS